MKSIILTHPEQPRQRLDQALVEMKLAPTRTKAQELVQRGDVSVEGVIVTDKAQTITEEQKAKIEIKATDFLEFASRAGHKLKGAIKDFNIQIQGKRCLDAGASTGGFTDCLLQYGAVHVTAFDVGHGQMMPQLKNQVKVTNIEGLNVKDVGANPQIPDDYFQIIVGDLSFISLTKALPHLSPKLCTDGQLIFLIKPQFEVGRKGLDKKGIVKADAPVEAVLQNIKTQAESLNLQDVQIITSTLAGRDGNQEYFLYGKKHGAKA